MGVLPCYRNCGQIMCSTLLPFPVNDYICGSCLEEFKIYMNQKYGTNDLTDDEIIYELGEFGKKDSGIESENPSVNAFIENLYKTE